MKDLNQSIESKSSVARVPLVTGETRVGNPHQDRISHQSRGTTQPRLLLCGVKRTEKAYLKACTNRTVKLNAVHGPSGDDNLCPPPPKYVVCSWIERKRGKRFGKVPKGCFLVNTLVPGDELRTPDFI